jgi:pyrroline-5-carboxylate reductase
MINKSIGFIGGGRVTRVILGGFKRAGEMPKQVAVTDTNRVLSGDFIKAVKEAVEGNEMYKSDRELLNQVGRVGHACTGQFACQN